MAGLVPAIHVFLCRLAL